MKPIMPIKLSFQDLPLRSGRKENGDAYPIGPNEKTPYKKMTEYGTFLQLMERRLKQLKMEQHRNRSSPKREQPIPLALGVPEVYLNFKDLEKEHRERAKASAVKIRVGKISAWSKEQRAVTLSPFRIPEDTRAHWVGK
jgi:hypothetical protein